MNTSIDNFSDATMTSLAAGMALFFAAIPKIIGFAVILIIGWFVSSLLARVAASLLRTIKFNELSQRSGITDFVKKIGIDTDASGALANVAKWFIRLIALVVAFDALGLPAVSDVLRQLLMWLPNLLVALVLLVVGGLVAGALSRVVRAATAEAGFGNPGLLAKVAATAVWGFTIVVAVNQIGIATALVNTLFMAVVGAVAVALGLAFGLGGRETAAEIVKNWYQASKEAAPKIEVAAKATEAAVERETRQMGEGGRPGEAMPR